jgi:hypothetical protein
MISVHSYKRWDHAKAGYYFPKAKSTEAAIKACGGVIIPETEEKVAPHKVDRLGRYNPMQRKGISHGQFV